MSLNITQMIGDRVRHVQLINYSLVTTFVWCAVVYSTLIPKANAWLQDNQYVYLVKCETLEKKVSTVDEVTSDECMFIPRNHSAIYIKGLR